MADLLYDHGLDEWRDWATGGFVWLALLSSYTPDRAHHYVNDVAASEVTAVGYARSTVAGATRTVDTTGHKIAYDANDPNFGTPAAGQTVGFVALAKVVTTDADSPLLALYDITDFSTDGGAFAPVVNAAGVHYVDQGA